MTAEKRRELGVRTGLTAWCREVAQDVRNARYLDCHKESKGKGMYVHVDALKTYIQGGRDTRGEDRKVAVLMLQEQDWRSWTAQGSVPGYCEEGTEPSGFMNGAIS
jgi:hypothetical protein